jgi:hypothetical protein
MTPATPLGLVCVSLLLASVAFMGCAQSHDALGDGGRRDSAGGGACSVSSDCTLLPETCCGSCGAATATDMVAVADDDVEANRTRACRDTVACPTCFMEQDPFLLAVCSAGECEARNLRVDPLTSCTNSDECQLAPRECCACGVLSRAEVVAFNPARGSYADLVCDPRAECPPCVPILDGLRAECVSGHCSVVELGAP